MLSSSLEDYLEAIYFISRKKQAARAKDILKHMQVKASSVTGALRQLSEKGLINYAPYDLITLTSEGERLAKDVVCRHESLQAFLVNVLCIDEIEADESACKLEHAISSEILDRLVKFGEFVKECPRAGESWIKEFNTFCKAGKISDECESCINRCLEEYCRQKAEKKIEKST
jgi:DtxR family Mn-dependent transcriptional regulator